jgi:hypothetical protein
MTNNKSLVLRVCRADMTSKGGFKWPDVGGEVVARDWKPRAECGNGLHGWLYGQGDHTCVDYWQEPGAQWLVLEVDSDAIVMIGGKCKFPRATVRFVGDVKTATDYLWEHEPRSREVQVIGACRADKRDGTMVAVGALGTATAGRGTRRATEARPRRATAARPRRATEARPRRATAARPRRATAARPRRATAARPRRAPHSGTATAGDSGTATAGDSGTATAGYSGTATAGDSGTATAGALGTATAGYSGTATAGYSGTATAGSGTAARPRRATAARPRRATRRATEARPRRACGEPSPSSSTTRSARFTASSVARSMARR